ncbi:MAG: hypothetical protein IAF38_10325 [Bacteroidia bacterium]|nr:hypothetical protein [Bacteroidia bacterium]
MKRLFIILTIFLIVVSWRVEKNTRSIIGEYKGKCYGNEWCSLEIEEQNEFTFYVEGDCFSKGTYEGKWSLHSDTLKLVYTDESCKFKAVKFANNKVVKYLVKGKSLNALNDKDLIGPGFLKKMKP